MYPLCKNGHERSPENRLSNGSCKKCALINKKEYDQTEKGKLAITKWNKLGYDKKRKDKTKCKRGHDRNAENLNSDGHCKLCLKEIYNMKKLAKPPKRITPKTGESKSYVASLLYIPSASLTDELFEFKLLTLQIKRGIKQCQKIKVSQQPVKSGMR